MFGQNCGLNNQEMTYANKILVIDTDKNFTSLNIAHAVSIVCYELFGAKSQKRGDLNNAHKLATQVELNYFIAIYFVNWKRKIFSGCRKKKEHMTNKIRNLFSRIDKPTSRITNFKGIITVLADDKNY